MICEKCGKDHDGSYASGRFCSSKCARSFATRDKRAEINAKVTVALTGRYRTPGYDYTCHKCGVDFHQSRKIRDDGRPHTCSSCKRVVKNNANADSIEELSSRTISKILRRAGIGCSICGWNRAICDLHHIVERHKGGTDDHDNLTYICPNCHREVHETDRYTPEFLRSISFDKVLPNWKDFFFPKEDLCHGKPKWKREDK